MTISWAYLAATLVGLWFTVQALRPVRFPRLLAIPSFFAGWLTNELIFHHYVWQAAATVGFVVAGALQAWPGWVGLGVTALQWAGNAVVVRDVVRTESVVDAALRDGLGEAAPGDAALGDAPGDAAPGDTSDGEESRGLLRRHLLMPFWLRHPDVERRRDITFATVGARTLTLDVYRNRGQGEGDRRPVLLYVHGGAWVIGNKDQQGIPLMLEMAARGWVGVNANYRLSPAARFPEHLVDVKRAIAWIREHAGEIGADPSFVAAAGGSAGGHLAALAALTGSRRELQPGFEDADTTLQACVPFYGVYDPTDQRGTHPEGFRDYMARYVVQASLQEAPERFRLASPIDQVSADAPPTMVIHGARDTLAPLEDARWFVEVLSEVSTAPVVRVELPGAQHAFDVFPSLRTAHVLSGVAHFLSAVRRRQQAAHSRR